MQPTLSIKRYRYSLRSLALALLLCAIGLAIASGFFHRAKKRQFEANTVNPILRTFISSVGTANGHVLWLRLNDIDPHHPNGYDQWVVPIPIADMYINDGVLGGPHSTFHDDHLEQIASEHPQLQALDLRRTAVTDKGLRHLTKLDGLKWLWLDPDQCSDDAMDSLNGMASLQSLWLDPDAVSVEALSQLKKSLPDCEISDGRLPEASRERTWVRQAIHPDG